MLVCDNEGLTVSSERAPQTPPSFGGCGHVSRRAMFSGPVPEDSWVCTDPDANQAPELEEARACDDV